MSIQYILLEKDFYQLYADYSGKQPIGNLLQKEVGEIVGYDGEQLLCLKKGKYYVRSLRGKILQTFNVFVNPYPLDIKYCIGTLSGRIVAKNAVEEVRWRQTLQCVKAMPGQNTGEKIHSILEHLDETGTKNNLVEIYRSCHKEMSCFLKEALKLYPPIEGEIGQFRNLISDLLEELACS